MSDLTSKAEVLETYAELFDMFDDSKEICKELCKVYDKIMGLPTIEPRRGKWIKDGEAYALYKCSVCNDFFPAVGYADCIPEERMYKTMKYCPNCGAKMERSEDA